MDVSPEEVWNARLLDVGRGLVTDLDLSVVLDRVLETARELTGARYAAIGVLNDQRTELDQFLTAGVDEPTREALLRIAWWDWPEEKVRRHRHEIDSPDVAGFVARHDPLLNGG